MKIRVTTEKIAAKATGVPAFSLITWADLTEAWSTYTNPWSDWIPTVASEVMKVNVRSESINAKVI